MYKNRAAATTAVTSRTGAHVEAWKEAQGGQEKPEDARAAEGLQPTSPSRPVVEIKPATLPKSRGGGLEAFFQYRGPRRQDLRPLFKGTVAELWPTMM